MVATRIDRDQLDIVMHLDLVHGVLEMWGTLGVSSARD